MYFRIMDYKEYLLDFVPNWQNVALRGVRFYTWVTMMWHRYFASNWIDVSNDDDDYPFAIVEKDGLCQVYYPELEATEYTFISGIVRVNDRDEYDLALKPYFVVGNRILDRDFVRWYLKINNQVDLGERDNYEVYLMDHNCEQVNVMSDECIKLNKDNYLKIKSDE